MLHASSETYQFESKKAQIEVRRFGRETAGATDGSTRVERRRVAPVQLQRDKHVSCRVIHWSVTKSAASKYDQAHKRTAGDSKMSKCKGARDKRGRVDLTIQCF